jgi:hypothetical protein
MPAQVMKASHSGWVDFTKGLVTLPATAAEYPAAERNHSEARRGSEGGRMEGLRLAIAGLPMSVLAFAAVPALAQSNYNTNFSDATETSDSLRLVDIAQAAPATPAQTEIQSNKTQETSTTANVQMIQADRSSVFAPAADMIQARSAMTLPEGTFSAAARPVAASMLNPASLPTPQLGFAAITGAAGLLLARRRSPIK